MKHQIIKLKEEEIPKELLNIVYSNDDHFEKILATEKIIDKRLNKPRLIDNPRTPELEQKIALRSIRLSKESEKVAKRKVYTYRLRTYHKCRSCEKYSNHCSIKMHILARLRSSKTKCAQWCTEREAPKVNYKGESIVREKYVNPDPEGIGKKVAAEIFNKQKNSKDKLYYFN